jgi:trimethylamine--corrinoid protein Co-methyltransferase
MKPFFGSKQRTWGLRLDILSEDELEDIHLATLELLQKTGIFVENSEALDLFANAGAQVNRQTKKKRDRREIFLLSSPN